MSVTAFFRRRCCTYLSFAESGFYLVRAVPDQRLRSVTPFPPSLELSFSQLMARVFCEPSAKSSSARQYQPQQYAALCDLVQHTLSLSTEVSMAHLQLMICEYARPSYAWLDKALGWYASDHILSKQTAAVFRLVFNVAGFGDISWLIRALTERSITRTSNTTRRCLSLGSTIAPGLSCV
jgi:hypothetical protein